MDAPTRALLARLIAFCLPGGDAAAQGVSAVSTKERGEMRSSPEARWIPFTAHQVIDSRRSSFSWEARMSGGGMKWFTITDAYSEGHGHLLVKLGGMVPVKQESGIELDQGELQRYLASSAMCPAMLVKHPSLEWSAAGPLTLRVGDRDDPTGATVDLDLGDDGRPLVCRAVRPRLVGKANVMTPWSGRYLDFQEREGQRIASELEVTWQYPEGPFTYYRGKVVSCEILHDA